jgi:hypothetical protein
MKLLLAILITVLLSNFIFAQPTFLGIKVEGPVSKIVDKLKIQGYTKEKNVTDEIIKLTNGKDNILLVHFNYNNVDLIWKAGIVKPSNSNWYSLQNEYNELKTILITKYGEFTKSYEFFSSPYTEDDGYQLQALRSDKCTYYTFWDVDNGSISLRIRGDASVCISYENTINSSIRDNIEKQKLSDGL